MFRRIDRVKVKRTSLRAYESVVGESVASGDSERAVLLVAVAGKVVPEFGRGTTYRWGVLVVDEVTGEPLSLRAGPERWPPFFSGVS